MTSTRVRQSLLAVAFFGGAVLVYAVGKNLPPREPRYEGRSLTYWFRRFRMTRSPGAECGRALECIGTSNVSLLVGWLNEKDIDYRDPWYVRGANWFQSKIPFLRHRERAVSMSLNPSRPTMASLVFSQVPAARKAALPE